MLEQSTDDFEHHNLGSEVESDHPKIPNFNYKHFERVALQNIGLDDANNEIHLDTSAHIGDTDNHTAPETIYHSDDDNSVELNSFSLNQRRLLSTDNIQNPETKHQDEVPLVKSEHIHLPTREEKMEYAKKVSKTLFTIFLLILMCSMTGLDIITSPKTSWVARSSIFVAMVIFWRFLYEYLFEIILEWILEYIYREDNIKHHKV